eukprot:CAMPEP_0167748500 /NCGR_PEP_ID=MMETSP0110_2-20121227/4872_1 /TAXON_ID=629695 /ORGANISM="Gymnochlora sp., Strain CCMP2014" /LENGTH=239 /DNA_ID=CAMNT_0007633521 /DNA_START=350 /DNA_END=1066 /DNA_ORIENTATION=+
MSLPQQIVEMRMTDQCSSTIADNIGAIRIANTPGMCAGWAALHRRIPEKLVSAWNNAEEEDYSGQKGADMCFIAVLAEDHFVTQQTPANRGNYVRPTTREKLVAYRATSFYKRETEGVFSSEASDDSSGAPSKTITVGLDDKIKEKILEFGDEAKVKRIARESRDSEVFFEISTDYHVASMHLKRKNNKYKIVGFCETETFGIVDCDGCGNYDIEKALKDSFFTAHVEEVTLNLKAYPR